MGGVLMYKAVTTSLKPKSSSRNPPAKKFYHLNLILGKVIGRGIARLGRKGLGRKDILKGPHRMKYLLFNVTHT